MGAFLRAELRAADGTLLATRAAHNAVLQSGARLIADLFAGRGAAITHMMVGTSDAPETEAFSTAALQNDPSAPLAGDLDAPIAPEDFSAAEIDAERRLVKIRVRGTLPPSAAVGVIREAALVSRTDAGTTLYNRVIMAPVTKGDDHELTLFWEITFPFGDLQWLP
jgi:hypothetical protein